MTMLYGTTEIGTFSKRTLLTGAGWTRNWGGKLASEIWQDLLGNPLVRGNSRLRELLLREQSFEVALGLTQLEPFTQDDREIFQKALVDVFVRMDREISGHDHDPWINIYGVQELVYRFWGGASYGVDTGYIFTLNQDLWPERFLYNEMANGAPKPSLPGLIGIPHQQFFTTGMDVVPCDLTMQVVERPSASALRGHFNIVKLHGSFNWRTAGPNNAMVVGTGKTEQISASPLLAWYFDIFNKVLSSRDVRLMIVGYGFGDEHVNAVIADAIERHNLQVFIWDTGPNLRERILAAPCGPSIWSGLLSTASRPMIEMFPSNQAKTEEYRRIIATCFG